GSVEQRIQAKPDGIERHHCVLAILEWSRPSRTITMAQITALATEAGFSATSRTKLQSGLPPDKPNFTRAQIETAATDAGARIGALEVFKQRLAATFRMA